MSLSRYISMIPSPKAAVPQSSFIRPKSLPPALIQRECADCEKDEKQMQRKEIINEEVNGGYDVESYLGNIDGRGQVLPDEIRNFYEPRFGYDFSDVKMHTDSAASQSAQSIKALAYTSGNNIVFNNGQYSPHTDFGKRLLGHELTHVVQQRSGIHSKTIQCQGASYIKKITVHLTPPETADLEWSGTPPAGLDHFPVSTGKGYSDPGDPPGTCLRDQCDDAMTQCTGEWTKPSKVGACCTYHGSSFWTGIPKTEHNGYPWWTPIQPYYGQRGIALHGHDEVTGDPIGHGCVRMDPDNAKRIFDFSKGKATHVTIDGVAAPVLCRPSAQKINDLIPTDNDKIPEGLNQRQPVEMLEGVRT